MTDEQLVGALRAGDRESLGVLIDRWEQPLYRFVYRMVPRPEDASDVCQETFLRVFRKADRFRDGSRFSTWMYQIALNLCRDQARKRQRWSRILAPAPAPRDDDPATDRLEAFAGDDDPAVEAEERERRRALRRALKRIPAEQREVLVMKEYQGMKFREIAEILGCPESTVKSRMYYGLKGLRDQLAGGETGGARTVGSAR